MSRRKSKGLGEAGNMLLKPTRRGSSTGPDGQERREGSLVSALQRQGSDDGGIVRDLPLEMIADHPDNPSQRLADIEDLADSIREVGVLQPIVVVPVAVFRAHWSGAADAVPEGCEWVAYMGHRRKAASRLAQLQTIPAIVRPDLDKADDAPTAFIVENLHRKDLEPLEEARAYGALADLGHGQNEIASRCGVSQGHVSKRVRLLSLPPRIQEALPPVGKITLEEADKLTSLTDPDQQIQVFDRSQRTGAPIASLLAELEAQRKDRERIDAARAQAEAAGVEIIDAKARFGPAASAHRLEDSAAIEAARQDGTLAAEPTQYGLRYYTTEQPAPVAAAGRSTPSGAIATASGDEVPAPVVPPSNDDAVTVRRAACGEYVRKGRPKRKTAVVDDLAAVLLTRVDLVDAAVARNLAYGWLGETIGDSSAVDAGSWIASLASDEAAWAAYATCVAVDELITQSDPSGAVARDHIRRLVDAVDYVPTAAEADQIAQTVEYSGGISEGPHS